MPGRETLCRDVLATKLQAVTVCKFSIYKLAAGGGGFMNRIARSNRGKHLPSVQLDMIVLGNRDVVRMDMPLTV